MAARPGYRNAADLAENYPAFFWKMVRPYIGPAAGYRSASQEGQQWMASLYAHVFAAEHGEVSLGPEKR